MYYIYHIPGIKIGCSINPKIRVKAQKYDYFEILEQHSDINVAAIREIELQKQYGYHIDKGSNVYSVKFFTKMGKIGGSKNTPAQQKARAENRKKSKTRLNSKIQSELAKKAFKAQNVELICPHCSKVGIGRVMYRHHFDRCKHNPNQ
jgi:hypothetical protein